jgi:PAS domain S-box-containing protein
MTMMEFSPNLDDLSGALVVYDAAGTLIKANQAALDILGAAPEELIGSRASDAEWVVTDATGWPDAENLHPVLAAIRSQQPQRGVVARVIRPAGAEVWIQVDAVPVTTSTGIIRHVVVTLADVTRILTDNRLPHPGYGDTAVAKVTEKLVSAPLDPQAILSTVTSTLSKLRSGTWVAALLKKDPSTSRVVAANDADPQVAEYIQNIQLHPNAPTFTISTRVIESGEPVLITSVPFDEFIGMLNPDVRDYLERNVPPVASPIRYLGVLVAPMRARGAVVGTLGLFERRGSNPLTERDVRWVQAIADRTGLAADNAQLYVDAVNRLVRLSALRSVTLAILGSPDLGLTLRVILDQTIAGLGVDAADVLLVDEKAGMLGQVASTGFHSTSAPDYRLPIDRTLPGRAVLGRRIESVTEPGAFKQFRRASVFAREGFKAYVAVPLIARDKLVGVLEVFHRSQLEQDQEWSEFLGDLSSDAAIAIDCARMAGALGQLGTEGGARTKAPPPDLSPLQKEILVHVLEGLPNRVIAEKVHRSHHTVKFHIGQMLDKVGVSNRTELARKATQDGWL